MAGKTVAGELVFIINDPVVGLGTLRAAAAHGRRCTVIARRGCRFLRYCRAVHIFHEVEESDIADRLGAVLADLKLLSRETILIPVGDISTRAVIALVEDDAVDISTFPVPDSAAFELLHRKDKFGRLCNELGLPTPKTVEVGERSDLSTLMGEDTLRFPIIVKPIAMSGGIGIEIIRDRAALQKLIDNPGYDYGPMVVQEYIEGQDVDFSLLASNGRIVTAYAQQKRNGVVSFPKNEAYLEIARKIVAHTHYTGMAHIDGRIDGEGRLYLIEFNARFWASVCWSRYPGIDFIGEGLKVAETGASNDTTYIHSAKKFSLKQGLKSILKGAPLDRSEGLRMLNGAVLDDPMGMLLTRSRRLRHMLA